jgi:hypothetical protein
LSSGGGRDGLVGPGPNPKIKKITKIPLIYILVCTFFYGFEQLAEWLMKLLKCGRFWIQLPCFIIFFIKSSLTSTMGDSNKGP